MTLVAPRQDWRSSDRTRLVRAPVRQLKHLRVRDREWLVRVGDALVVLVSVLAATAAWALMARVPFGRDVFIDQEWWVGAILLGWAIWFAVNDMYSMYNILDWRRSVRKIASGGLGIGAVYMVNFFLTYGGRTGDAERATLRLAPALALVGSTAALIGFRYFVSRAGRSSATHRRLVVVGSGPAAEAIAEVINGPRGAAYHLVGYVADLPPVEVLGSSMHVGRPEQLFDIVQSHRVDEIVLASDDSEMEGTLFQQLMDCHEQGVAIHPMPVLFERLTGKVAVNHVGSHWYVALPVGRDNQGLLTAAVCRVFDLVLGVLAALAFAVSLPFVALAIRLDSKGPVFYGQDRVGLHGRVFRVWKYRSMFTDAEASGRAEWAAQNDPRVTRVGRILRKTRIDELPQALAVLRGHMSMVGPCPERPELVTQLEKDVPFYRARLAAKPGLTGWAQINQGYVSSVEDTVLKLQYDLYYIKNLSPWLYLLVIGRTIGVVLMSKGR